MKEKIKTPCLLRTYYGKGSLWVIKIIYRCYLPWKRSQSIISAYVVINYLCPTHTREAVLWPGTTQEMSQNVLRPKGCGMKKKSLTASPPYSAYVPEWLAHSSACYCGREKSNPTAILVFLMEKTICADERVIREISLSFSIKASKMGRMSWPVHQPVKVYINRQHL